MSSQWLLKFTKKPPSPTDIPDIVHNIPSMSGMSVPNPPIFGKKQDEISEEKEKRYAVPIPKEGPTHLTAENGDIQAYKRFFEQRKVFHLGAGLSEEAAAWKAANDTAYLFMDNTGTTVWDREFRDFMDVLYHMYPSLKMVS